LWVGTRDGLLKFNTNTETFRDMRTAYGRGYEVRSIYKDNTGNYWLCTSSGLKVIFKDGRMKEYSHDPSNPNGISGNNVIDVIPYKNGNYLIGVDGGGIDYFDVLHEKFYHYTEELSSTNINCLYKDSKGDIWAGTYLNGMNYSNTTTNLFVLKKNNQYAETCIRKGIVTSFLKDRQDNLWVATDGGGLYRKNKGSNIFIHYPASEKGLTSNVVF
jgi:ligand-binding sensor domain-containing protein